MSHYPPKWADKFLKWYCNPELLDEIQGDAYELFERRIKEDGKKKANRKYIWDVIRFFRWSNIKKSENKALTSNNIPMFKNYLKVGFRNLSKNWVTSSINIFGLAIGIGCAITTFIFLDNQTHMDSFHKNASNIYQVTNLVFNENEIEMWGHTPLLLGPALKDKYAAIDGVSRFDYEKVSMRYEKNTFSEYISFVDPDFLKMFDFPIKYGNKSVLEQKENIVISDKVATKYFGDEDPMGKSMSIKYKDGSIKSYFVKGVLDKIPFNASFRPDILVPIANMYDNNKGVKYSWSSLTNGVFISIKPGNNPNDFNLEEFKNMQNEASSKRTIDGYEFIALKDLYIRAADMRGSIAMSGAAEGRLVLGIIAFLLLLLACFNYMNISVSSATKRIKEIAMRKVMGSARRNIINQFLLENLVLCGFALILGIALSFYVFLPGSRIVNPEMEIPFEFSSFPLMIGFLSGLLILVGLASGAYPALYISKFEPVHIFSGSQKFSSKGLFSKILLTFQLLFAITTVVACFVYAENTLALNDKDWGYDPNGIISVPVNNLAQYQQLKNAASKNPDIKFMAGSYGQIGVFDPTTKLDNIENSFRMVRYKVSNDYFKATNLRLKSGRFFNQENESSAIIVNEKFVKRMGWDTPLNQSVMFDSLRRNVVGVVEDFHYDFFYAELNPVMFVMGDEADFNYLTINTEAKNEIKTDQYLKESWQKIAPNDPYQRTFQTDVFNTQFLNNKATTTIFLFISVIALLLASLGLFGLLSFNLQKRMKEFGVRKVLGANALNIAKLANKEYVWTLFVSFAIGAPAGFMLIDQIMVAMYPDPQPMTWLPIIMSIIIMLVTFAITVSTQIWKATKVNPAEILRSE